MPRDQLTEPSREASRQAGRQAGRHTIAAVWCAEGTFQCLLRNCAATLRRFEFDSKSAAYKGHSRDTIVRIHAL